MATITVGQGKQYSTIAAGVAAARDGDTVAVSAGTYLDDVATIRSRISLVAVGGQVTVLGTRLLGSGGALLTVAADAIIDGFVFSGANARDGSAAAVLYRSGALTIRRSLFVGNQTGLLALGDPAGTILIEGSEFNRNGAGDGFSHNIAVGAVKTLTVRDSFVHDAIGGAEIRSRARTTTITGSRIVDGGAATVSLDFPNGGLVSVQESVIVKGAGSGAVVIRMGGETAYAGSLLRVTGSTVVGDGHDALLVQNATSTAASVAGNTLYGFGTTQFATGPAVLSGNTTAAVRPVVSTAALIEPAFALPEEHGRAGAVVATGVVRTVGAGAFYATVAEAVAAAQDGDTIRVAAGTYTDDTAIVTHRVIIEGVGGLARFVGTTTPLNGLAQFVVTTDATFRNVEIVGVAIPGGMAAAILDQGGDLTVVNSFIHDNQAGIVALDDAGGSVGVYDTEIARNGVADGRGGNIDVAGIGTLTVRNSLVRDGLSGAEIRSRADNTALDMVRISQAHGAGSAALALPDGGRVSVVSSAIEKGAGSEPAPLIQVGGGSAGSSLTVSGTTLVSGAGVPFVSAEAGSASVTVTGSTFVGAAVGGVLVQNGSNSGAVFRSGVSVGTVAPWGVSGAPVAGPLTATLAAPAASRGVLALRVSGDAWQGEARFTVAVDGAPVGGTLVAGASHGAGGSQAFVIAGQFAPGPHSVTVRFVNDLNGATGVGRALYLDGVTFNGEAFGAPAALHENGAVTVSTGASTRPVPVTVSLSADAPAEVFIAIDGRVLGGLQAVTASHGAGGTQGMRFLVDLAPGPHVATVTPLSGRPVYVDSIDVAGELFAGRPAPLDGPAATGFTVTPAAAANTDLFLTAMLPDLVPTR